MENSSSTEVSSVASTQEVCSVVATPMFDGSHWGRLPTELLLQILRYHLTFPNPIKRQTQLALLKMHALPLLLTKDEGFVRYQHIRRLVFLISSTIGYSTDMPGYQGQWDANWGASLPRLDSLSVKVTIQEAADYYYYMRGYGSISGIEPGPLTRWPADDYVDTLKPKTMALNPKKVTFVVVCEGCPFRYDHHGLDCSCASRFEKNITQRILGVPEPTTAG